jgi:hypothetical protein
MTQRVVSTPHSRRVFATGVAATALAAGFTGVAAQGSTPPAGGMSVEETQALLDNYLNALFGDGDFGQFVAEDGSFVIMETGDRVSGRDNVVNAIITLHTVQFDAAPELTNQLVGAGTAGLEVVFIGTHTADFGGIAASGTQVNVPYSAFYTMADGLITEIRLYGLACGLMNQLAAAGTPTVATPVG